MGEEIQGLDPGLLKLGKIRLLMTVNTNSGRLLVVLQNIVHKGHQSWQGHEEQPRL
jgi:hypothetical protein